MSKGVQGPAYIGKLKVGKQQFTGNYEKTHLKSEFSPYI